MLRAETLPDHCLICMAISSCALLYSGMVRELESYTLDYCDGYFNTLTDCIDTK